MLVSKNKKLFKLNVLGLIKWESEGWTVKEVAFILIIVMVFILAVIIALKIYAIPTMGTPVLINKFIAVVGKIIKSRAP